MNKNNLIRIIIDGTPCIIAILITFIILKYRTIENTEFESILSLSITIMSMLMGFLIASLTIVMTIIEQDIIKSMLKDREYWNQFLFFFVSPIFSSSTGLFIIFVGELLGNKFIPINYISIFLTLLSLSMAIRLLIYLVFILYKIGKKDECNIVNATYKKNKTK